MTYYEAYRFLKKHPKGDFWDNMESALVMVDSVTHRAHRIPGRNTCLEVWLETGPVEGSHDIRLDCGGSTFEHAIVKMATLVKKYY